jgi:hypothetical protein
MTESHDRTVHGVGAKQSIAETPVRHKETTDIREEASGRARLAEPGDSEMLSERRPIRMSLRGTSLLWLGCRLCEADTIDDWQDSRARPRFPSQFRQDRMEGMPVVLVEAERQRECANQVLLQLPRRGMDHPRDEGVLAHPLGERSLTRPERQSLATPHALRRDS